MILIYSKIVTDIECLPSIPEDDLLNCKNYPLPNKSFFLMPTSEGEVAKVIISLKDSSCSDKYHINKYQKRKRNISYNFNTSYYFNYLMCVTGNFPDTLKLQK